MRRAVAILMLCWCGLLAAVAQCPVFTDLTAPGVVCQYGTFDDPFQNTGIVAGRHTVITQQGTDPNTGNQLPLLPPGESAVVKLGNDNIGSEAEAVTYTITVDQDHSILQVKFAVVFEDPSHPISIQPRFMVRVLNMEGELIDSCAQYDVSAAYSLAGFHSYHSVRYRPWSLMSVNLSDYSGQQVKLQFVTYDCGWQGHFGYAYFTASCISNQLTINNITGNQITVSAPEGFPNYNWDNNTHTNPTTYVLNQGVTSVNCLVTTTVNCYFTLSGLFASGAGTPTASGTYYDTICEGESYHLHYFNLLPQEAVGTHVYRSTFLDPSNPEGEEIVITLYLTILKRYEHIYDHICVGSDYVANGFHIIQPPAGKLLDTLFIQTGGRCDSAVILHLSVSPPFTLPASLSGPTIVCDAEEVVYAWPDAIGLDTIHWTVPIGMSVISGLYASSLRAYFSADAPNPAVLTVYAINGCGSGTRTISVTHNPSYHLFVRDTLCSGDEYHEHGFHLARQDSVGLFTFSEEGVTAKGCDSNSTLQLLVVRNPELTTLAQPEELCAGESTVIHAMGSNAGFEQGGYTAPPVAVGDILCTDSTIVKPADWPVAGKTAMGVVFYVDNTDEHGWAVSLSENTNKLWSPLWSPVDIDSLPNYNSSWDAMGDFDGYTNTQIIRNSPSTNDWLSQQEAYPAVWALDFDNGWYLPALGQLRIMYGYYQILNTSMQLVGGTLFSMDTENSSYWSSTEQSYWQAYCITANGQITMGQKYGSALKVRGVINF